VLRSLAIALVLGGSSAACGGGRPDETVPPHPLPIPTAGIAGRPVTLYPLTMIAAEPALAWDDSLRPREAALHRADSVIGTFLTERAPEVEWILPGALRDAARRAPGMLTDPDRMGTALLRSPSLSRVPDPLRSQLRNLTGVVGDRYAAVPAALAYYDAGEAGARAELSLVLVDVRNGTIGWRTVARGEGGDPGSALWAALTTLVPDLP
jgi:hypothetical protein